MSDPELQAALSFHRAGRLAEAEERYRALLRRHPAQAQAMHLLGLVLDQSGRRTEAVQWLEQAIARSPSADFYNSLGLVKEALGRAGEAEDCYRHALRFDPKHLKALNNLGGTLQSRGALPEAAETYGLALRINPQMPSAWNNLGTVLQAQGRREEAIEAYREALRWRPAYPEALANWGSALIAAGDFAAAATALEQALVIQAQYPRALLLLGTACLAMGRPSEALGVLERAVAQAPGSAEAHYQLGRTLAAQSRLDEAAVVFGKALELRPDHLPALDALAGVEVERIDLAAAAARYQQAQRLHQRTATRIKLATMLPAICDSLEEIASRRQTMEGALDQLLEQTLAPEEPMAAASSGGFFLAYHGLNDRHLQTKIARVYERACPKLQFTAAHCDQPEQRERIRVGFISRFMFRHSIGRTTRGLVATLSRQEFEVFALFIPPLVEDEISNFIRGHAHQWRVLSGDLESARAEIAALQLDVLFFQDIGLDPFSYFLAFARLAPVQCVSFGHPDTTGIPNMDYFVSNSFFEPEDAGSHYSERLFCLRDLGTLAYYYRPSLQQPARSRRALGLPDDRRVYLCPQSLFKFHPEIDTLFAEILRGDPGGDIYLVAGRVPHRIDRLQQRFARAHPDVCERIKILPSCNEADFLNLIAVSDVMLDTLHFNGMNTSLEAIAMGVPVVTWPRALQRGRHTAGMFRRMGLSDWVAQSASDYVAVALRLGTDADFRAETRRQLGARAEVLFEEERVSQEFARFFHEAMVAVRQS